MDNKELTKILKIKIKKIVDAEQDPAKKIEFLNQAKLILNTNSKPEDKLIDLNELIKKRSLK